MISCFPSFAIRRIISRDRSASVGDLYDTYSRVNREFGRLVCGNEWGNANVVYVFNGAGLEILEQAKQRGMFTVVEQTDAPVPVEEGLLNEERERWPGWEQGGVSKAAWQPMAEREIAEWKIADLILCGSEYVRRGVLDTFPPPGLTEVVPYGISPDLALHGERHRLGNNPELMVLFVGTICLRKGVPYLLEAAKQLKGIAKIRALGPVRVSESARAMLAEHIELVGVVPRSQVRQYYATSDVLVLPSISEGSANVCYEAIASGIPVITTPNAGSVIRDEKDGFILPIRASDAIVDAIVRLAKDRELLNQLGESAYHWANEFTWERYSQRLVGTLRTAFENRASSKAEWPGIEHAGEPRSLEPKK
ncbi:glycosyltransferase family 4 protein [Blastopirellula marina]|nr:glycosyltransferase family 4 protein [Blastopirellula marina]